MGEIFDLYEDKALTEELIFLQDLEEKEKNDKMVEEKQEDKKNPLVFKVLKYKGKELKKEGTDWKLFTLLFESDGNYPIKMSVFNTMGTKEGSKSITLKELEEGNVYNVGYKEETYFNETHNKDIINRTVMYMVESSKEPELNLNKKTAKELQNTQKHEAYIPPGVDEIDKDLVFIKGKLEEKGIEVCCNGKMLMNWVAKMIKDKSGIYINKDTLDSFKMQYDINFVK